MCRCEIRSRDRRVYALSPVCVLGSFIGRAVRAAGNGKRKSEPSEANRRRRAHGISVA